MEFLQAKSNGKIFRGMNLPPSCRLYTFIDLAWLGSRDPVETARQLCAGGSDLIQLRAKNSPPDQVRTLAEQILEVTDRAGVPLVINDHLAIALEVGARFCHLGQEDFFGAGHRQISDLKLPQGQLGIGLSTHAPAQALAAEAVGADYLAVGPVYPTPTKPSASAVTLDYVRWAAAHLQAPWFAIGGINLRTLDDVLAAGAERVCVVSAILQAPNPADACHEFKKRLTSARL